MPSNAKVPGDGKLRAATVQAGEAMEELFLAFKDRVESGPSEEVPGAFRAFKKAVRAYYDLMGDKVRRNQTIAVSQEEMDRFDRIVGYLEPGLKAGLFKAWPSVVKELDPYEPNVASMLGTCHRGMVVANKTQTLKGVPKERRLA